MSYPTPDLMSQAIKFRKLMDQPIGTLSPKVTETQLRLIREEWVEVADAYINARDHVYSQHTSEQLLKELADLVFVCFQFAATTGWELGEAMDRVYESNISKLVDGKPLKREDGKVLKGPNYHPPYLADLV